MDFWNSIHPAVPKALFGALVLLVTGLLCRSKIDWTAVLAACIRIALLLFLGTMLVLFVTWLFTIIR